ncbi:uncharacterized protein LOC132702476 [Cylas formicarius]|uniref:uncharacterized protein LOC132702476 n=1 Tax=Cylas formicarius TaxID=197179 RepID=UPI002958D11A|nr:uncharacterized protein LOC132702476 [Cylas formicarius]
MQRFYILLLFFNFLSPSQLSLLPFSKHPPPPVVEQTSSNLYTSSDKLNRNDDACFCSSCLCPVCNVTLAAPKKVINVYRPQIENSVPPKPFGSFCAKCAACLAVAAEMQQVIDGFGEECELDETKRKSLQRELSVKVTHLCRKGFKSYDSGSLGKYNITSDYLNCAYRLENNTNWTKKLRELCELYLSRIDLERLSNAVWNAGENLSKKLCRSSGIFRDCVDLKCVDERGEVDNRD